MSPAKKSTKKTTRKSASTGRAKKTTARKATSKKKTTARRATPKKTTAKRTAAKKSTAKKKTSARKASPKKTTAKKTSVRKSVARKTTTHKPPARKPAVASSPARPPRRVKLDKKALAQVRKTLEDQRSDLLRQQGELDEDSFDSTQSDMTGEVGFDEDFADAGTATFDRERDLSIRNNIQDLIEQITRAIGRIDDGTYGICERCGRPIDAARLRALPHALLCMDCKRREERAR